VKRRLAIALVCFSSLAFAEPPPLAESLTGEAKAQYASARLLYGDADYNGALVKFTAAWRTSRDPRLLWNMAACEKNLRHYAKALRYVRMYAADTSGLVADKDRDEARELIKVMEPLTAVVRLEVSEPGAEVTVDGEVVGTSPLVEPIVVDLTARRVTAKKDGFREASSELAGRSDVQLSLAKIVHEGRLHVRAPSAAAIALDGAVVGTGTWQGTLASGGHTLRVTAPNMRPWQSEILVVDDQVRDVNVALEPEPTRVPTWAWIVGGGVLAAGLGVGGYFLFRSDPSYDGPSGNLDPGVVFASRPTF